MTNIRHLRTIRDYITDHPERFDMNLRYSGWMRITDQGTRACIVGLTLTLFPTEYSVKWSDTPTGMVITRVEINCQPVLPELAAAKILGLTGRKGAELLISRDNATALKRLNELIGD